MPDLRSGGGDQKGWVGHVGLGWVGWDIGGGVLDEYGVHIHIHTHVGIRITVETRNGNDQVPFRIQQFQTVPPANSISRLCAVDKKCP